MRKVVVLIVLMILPSLFLHVGTTFTTAYYGGDPSYIYLMNALNLARGKQAGHIDNPGTPVMELGAAYLALNHWINPGESQNLQTEILKNPDHYVNLIRQFFILLISLALFVAGWVIYMRLDKVMPALIIQLTPFLSVNLLEHCWSRVSPEPVLLLASIMLALLLVLYSADALPRQGFLMLFFILTGGFGLATKTTYLPLLIIPFFLLKGWKFNLICFAGTIAAFFIFTFPARHLYSYMFDWYSRLITHQGVYGSGEKGFTEISVYLRNIGLIFSNNRYFTSILGLAVALLTGSYFYRGDATVAFRRFRRILTALVAAGLLGVLVVAKHYFNNHYLIPVLALSGVMLYFSIGLAAMITKSEKLPFWISGSFLLIVVVVFNFYQLPSLRDIQSGYRFTNDEYTRVNRVMDCDYAGHFRIYHYPNGIDKFSALKFGSAYSRLSNQPALDSLYPRICFFNLYTSGFQYWEKPVSFEQVIKNHGTDIIIAGREIDARGMTILNESGVYVRHVFNGRFQEIYVLDSLAGDLAGRGVSIIR
jgi:hypothetical protein